MARRLLRPYLRDRLTRDLERYLIPGEVVVVSVRQDLTSRAGPIAACFALLFLAVWMDVKAPPTPAGGSAAQAFWTLWLASFFFLLWKLVTWWNNWFVATDRRFLLFYGVFHRRVAMMPLAKVTDLTFHRTLPGRLFGYGDFHLESAGQNQALSHIEYIPDAKEHYRAICEVLFGEERETDGLDDLWDEGDGGEDDWGDDGGDGGWDDGGGRHGGGGDTGPLPHDGPVQPYAVRPPRRPGPPWVGSRSRRGADGIPPSPIDEVGAPRMESLYRSDDLVKAERLADTGEIPVIVAKPMRPARDPQREPRRDSGRGGRPGDPRRRH